MRKLRIDNCKVWEHHRFGWKYVVSLLRENFHCDDGVRFVSAVEDEICEGEACEEPWVGFVHQVPHTDLKWFPDLSRVLCNERFLRSTRHCQGIFVLSTYLKRFLLSSNLGIPVAKIHYPSPPPTSNFDIDKYYGNPKPRLLFIGEYLRNFNAFYELQAPGFTKVLLKPQDLKLPVRVHSSDVNVVDAVSDSEYDQLLSENIVFLSLIDAPANTTIIECISRGTPILINRLEGAEEYLGKAYPLFYESLEEAQRHIGDSSRIKEAVHYLQDKQLQDTLCPKEFLKNFQLTAIYRALPLPQSQVTQDLKQTQARTEVYPLAETFNVSIVMCSYKRVHQIGEILKRLCDQDYAGKFEILLWNNNSSTVDELNTLFSAFQDKLALRLIQSSENFYCSIRLALANLIRSPLMLVLDDDVLPNKSYISEFMRKHEEYGSEAVLCCRGHVFLPHRLSEEHPELFWEEYEHLQFFDESIDDRQIHFMHADNCLIPKHLMLRASQYLPPSNEFMLVDDYWLSYVFSSILNIPIWKIRGDEIMEMTESSDDPTIALFHNSKVHEQRVRMYIEHMRRGWPDFEMSKVYELGSDIRRERYPSKKIRGFNMFSDSPESTWRAAAEYGIKVVRLGACGGALDFRQFVDSSGLRSSINEESTQPLMRALDFAKKYDIKVLLTLTHLPGRIFASHASNDLWTDCELQDEVVRTWRKLASMLLGHDEVAGLDLINEPYLPDEIGLSTSDDGRSAHLGTLNDFYKRLVREIREILPDQLLILESSRWASPLTLEHLTPIDDSNVAYSFHMYMPHVFTNRAKNQGKLCYPGLIPDRPVDRWAEAKFWDKSELKSLLEYVHNWQLDNNITSEKIFVGEFGVSRETRGANEYLTDLIDIMNSFGWNWCAYAFREDAWDAMDYELGPDINNMLNRKNESLFRLISEHFKQ
jgi:glycosyltransferase involved in cell wall biosynthesis